MTEHASSLGNTLTAGVAEAALDRTTMLGAGLLAALVVLPHFPLQVTNDAIGTSVSFELCLRPAVCAACGIYGLCYLGRSARHLEKFPVAWCVLFGVWSMFSLFAAADLRVGTVACGVFWCTLVFLPAIVTQLGKERTLLVLLAASLLYVGGQWALFLAGSEPRLERGTFRRRRGLSPRRRFAGFGISRRPSRRRDARAGASPFASPTLVGLGRRGNHVGRHKKPHGHIRNGRRVRPAVAAANGSATPARCDAGGRRSGHGGPGVARQWDY